MHINFAINEHWTCKTFTCTSQPSGSQCYARIISLIVLGMLLTSCAKSPTFDTVYTRVTESSLKAGMEIPQPQDAPMLTASGKIGSTNAGETAVMDRATIEQVGVVEYAVLDPFEERTITYRGVLMRDLLDLLQIADDAKEVKLTALNDYEITVPVTELYNYPVLFALQADDMYMEPDYRGPAMLVFPLDDYEFDQLLIRRWWIWQIVAIELI